MGILGSNTTGTHVGNHILHVDSGVNGTGTGDGCDLDISSTVAFPSVDNKPK